MYTPNTPERSMLIPCHVWTPHFGVYGSTSGFDSLEEAFGDLTIIPGYYGEYGRLSIPQESQETD